MSPRHTQLPTPRVGNGRTRVSGWDLCTLCYLLGVIFSIMFSVGLSQRMEMFCSAQFYMVRLEVFATSFTSP